MCAGKLSKDWNGGGCILSNMRLTEESTDQLSESICAFCVLVNNSHLPESGVSVGICICPLQSGLYLLALAEIFDLNCVFLSSFQFQESGMFQNIEWGKRKKTWWP